MGNKVSSRKKAGAVKETGKHERHDLMVYDCNETTSPLWRQRQTHDFVFPSRGLLMFLSV